MRNTARLISALLLCGLLFGRMPHAAAADSGIKAESGDLNADGIADRTDVILLQNRLLTVQDPSLPDAQAADLNGDNCLNAADLTAETGLTLRIKGFQPGPDYEPDPISSLDPKNDPLYLRGSGYNLSISDEKDGMIP